MTKLLRVVVDTNVLVSGLFGIKDSAPSKILETIRNQHFILVSSPAIIEEVKEVINRIRIVKLTGMTKRERKKFIVELVKRCDVVSGRQIVPHGVRDRKDEMLLICANESKADYIITGDKDLLVLHEYANTKIITPKDFVDMLIKS